MSLWRVRDLCVGSEDGYEELNEAKKKGASFIGTITLLNVPDMASPLQSQGHISPLPENEL